MAYVPSIVSILFRSMTHTYVVHNSNSNLLDPHTRYYQVK